MNGLKKWGTKVGESFASRIVSKTCVQKQKLGKSDESKRAHDSSRILFIMRPVSRTGFYPVMVRVTVLQFVPFGYFGSLQL